MLPGVDRPPPEPVTRQPPRRVRRPVMTQRWADLAYLHWPCDPDLLAPHLPPGTRLDTHDGRAWVGLVPFVMREVRVARVVPPPPLGWFCETNVRTYSVGPDGRRGVVFLSLDAERALPVLVARTAFRLPYLWSWMRHERDGGVPTGRAGGPGAADPTGATVTYRCSRRLPGPYGARSLVRLRVGERVEPTALDDWLTARWGLHTARRGGTAYGPVEHPAWPLHAAELLDLDDGLVAAAGLPAPEGAPRVLWSPGVPVRIGWLEQVGR